MDKITLNEALFEISFNSIIQQQIIITNVFSQYRFLIKVFNSTIIADRILMYNCSNGFFLLQESNLTIKTSIFNNTKLPKIIQQASENSLIIMISKNKELHFMTLKNSKFIGFYGIVNGTILSISQLRANFLIENCFFINNNVQNFGGVIYIYQSGNITISNCSFQKNFATQGGAIYYDDKSSENSDLFLSILDNVFVNNHAYISGGALMFFQKIPNNTNLNSFYSNKADSYGNNEASEANRVIFLGNNENVDMLDMQNYTELPFYSFSVSTGSEIPTIKFVIIDYFYQIVNKKFGQYFTLSFFFLY